MGCGSSHHVQPPYAFPPIASEGHTEKKIDPFNPKVNKGLLREVVSIKKRPVDTNNTLATAASSGLCLSALSDILLEETLNGVLTDSGLIRAIGRLRSYPGYDSLDTRCMCILFEHHMDCYGVVMTQARVGGVGPTSFASPTVRGVLVAYVIISLIPTCVNTLDDKLALCFQYLDRDRRGVLGRDDLTLLFTLLVSSIECLMRYQIGTSTGEKIGNRFGGWHWSGRRAEVMITSDDDTHVSLPLATRDQQTVLDALVYVKQHASEFSDQLLWRGTKHSVDEVSLPDMMTALRRLSDPLLFGVITGEVEGVDFHSFAQVRRMMVTSTPPTPKSTLVNAPLPKAPPTTKEIKRRNKEEKAIAKAEKRQIKKASTWREGDKGVSSEYPFAVMDRALSRAGHAAAERWSRGLTQVRMLLRHQPQQGKVDDLPTVLEEEDDTQNMESSGGLEALAIKSSILPLRTDGKRHHSTGAPILNL